MKAQGRKLIRLLGKFENILKITREIYGHFSNYFNGNFGKMSKILNEFLKLSENFKEKFQQNLKKIS